MDARFSDLNDGHRVYSSPAGILARLAAAAWKTTHPRLKENGSFLEAQAMLDAFENQGNSLAYTDAHGAESVFSICPYELVERGGNKSRAAGAQRVAESNRTTV